MSDPTDRRDLDAAITHLHRLHRRARREHTELVALVKSLAELLGVDGQRLAGRQRQLAQALLEDLRDDEKTALAPPGPDKYMVPSPPDLDCAALFPVCKARCCKLAICLSPQDLDEGKLGWDYQVPYLIKKRPDGLCIYNETETGRCEVYQHRPGPCRSYDCRTDERIWKDFENRIPAD